MSERQKQVGRNENAARTSNEVVSVDGEQARLLGCDTLDVLCECGDSECHMPIKMTVDEYEHIRCHGAQFAVLPGHELLNCESVVETLDEYLIVEKYGDAAEVADAADPRFINTTCRVLIVDDMIEIRYLQKMMLALEPSCTVVGEASNGSEAVECADSLQPEIIVLDLEMPIMDGWHALPHLRRVSPTSHIIIFSATFLDARLEKRLKNLGADRFVRKGGDPAVLISAVRDVALSGRDRRFSRNDGDGDGDGRSDEHNDSENHRRNGD